jgi:hypothetical protein
MIGLVALLPLYHAIGVLGGEINCAIKQIPPGYFFGTDGKIAVQIKALPRQRLALEILSGSRFESYWEVGYHVKQETCEILLKKSGFTGFIYRIKSGQVESIVSDYNDEWSFRLKYSDGAIVMQEETNVRLERGPRTGWGSILKELGVKLRLTGGHASGSYTICNPDTGDCTQIQMTGGTVQSNSGGESMMQMQKNSGEMGGDTMRMGKGFMQMGNMVMGTI